MKIRLATAADIPAMHVVRMSVRENRLADPGRLSAADYADAIGTLGRGWVAEEGASIVGFAVGYLNGNVWALFVHPAHEGRGHGKALHGLRRLWLTTDAGTRAEAFYRSLGWVACGPWAGREVRLELDLSDPLRFRPTSCLSPGRDPPGRGG